MSLAKLRKRCRRKDEQAYEHNRSHDRRKAARTEVRKEVERTIIKQLCVDADNSTRKTAIPTTGSSARAKLSEPEVEDGEDLIGHMIDRGKKETTIRIRVAGCNEHWSVDEQTTQSRRQQHLFR